MKNHKKISTKFYKDLSKPEKLEKVVRKFRNDTGLSLNE